MQYRKKGFTLSPRLSAVIAQAKGYGIIVSIKSDDAGYLTVNANDRNKTALFGAVGFKTQDEASEYIAERFPAYIETKLIDVSELPNQGIINITGIGNKYINFKRCRIAEQSEYAERGSLMADNDHEIDELQKYTCQVDNTEWFKCGLFNTAVLNLGKRLAS